MHLRQPRLTDSACGPFTKNKASIQEFKEAGDNRYICQNKQEKTCLQHDIAYGVKNYLPRRTAFEKVLRDKAFAIAVDLHQWRIQSFL